MCRMIMAIGKFSAATLFEAAVNMSEGKTAQHQGPIRCHPNGWGLLWRNQQSMFVEKGIEKLKDGVTRLNPQLIQGDFAVLHARHATIAAKLGLQFSHPLIKHTPDTDWYFFHNGFMPTVYQALGLKESTFDTQEYADYVLPNVGTTLNRDELLAKLSALPVGGSSANAFIINKMRAYVVSWKMPSIDYGGYFDLYTTEVDGVRYISSEIQPQIAASNYWDQLPAQSCTEFTIGGEYAGDK